MEVSLLPLHGVVEKTGATSLGGRNRSRAMLSIRTVPVPNRKYAVGYEFKEEHLSFSMVDVVDYHTKRKATAHEDDQVTVLDVLAPRHAKAQRRVASQIKIVVPAPRKKKRQQQDGSASSSDEAASSKKDRNTMRSLEDDDHVEEQSTIQRKRLALKRNQSKVITVNRMAKGPDGTRGFAVGYRKRVDVAAATAADAATTTAAAAVIVAATMAGWLSDS
eukprot:TRINITY_DN67435_c7_g1_i4.p1 TRINITY_DN67435_c7_g1~~TRINITY_DN67435_c7_g1_i4.p1  ORF type:complete len:226 (-),score=116.87 TRINITY_DN67435_c7_g1_i4:83-739(-)